jgi:tRNA uridine 5-carboxymethylaminomethyl modification enzyme
MFHVKKMTALDDARTFAKSVSITPKQAEQFGLSLNKDGQRRTAYQLLSYPDVGVATLARIWPRLAELAPSIAEQIEIDAKYDVYLSRQSADIASYRRDEAIALPEQLDYAAINGLSNEVRQKLTEHRPSTIGQAARIDGITPAALTLLVAHLRRRGKKPAQKTA